MVYQLTMIIKRLNLEKPNNNPNFIGSWIIDDSLCNKLINYFEINKKKQTEGVSAAGLNKDYKDRTDISIMAKDVATEGNEIFKQYFEKGLLKLPRKENLKLLRI